ncbi:MAG: KpsF/GutQ family sugar-phosphate isomerase [Opitutae bacterium]|nr:KpsF/GutQ family sugar-phosphate isomerase [Opitutae bacterium]
MDIQSILRRARNFLSLESQAILDTAEGLDESFARVVAEIQGALDRQRKLVLIGLGKNAGICHKLVGTFNSTGVSSAFLDPVQAMHGDLGMCRSGDVALMVSNSGETGEILQLISLLKRMGLKTVAFTGNKGSTLARSCDFRLIYRVEEEACPLNLTPTASTTAALALGDALALVSLEMRHFGKEDFAKYHPSGTLGAALILGVEDIMRTGRRLAKINSGKSVQGAIVEMTRAKAGSIAIVDEDNRLCGIFTDADLRRAILKDADVFAKPIDAFMTRDPKKVSSHSLAAEALKMFEDNQIDDILVVDEENRPLGIIDGQDLPKLRLV